MNRIIQSLLLLCCTTFSVSAFSSDSNRLLLQLNQVNQIALEKRWMPYQDTLYIIHSDALPRTLLLSLKGIPNEKMTLSLIDGQTSEQMLEASNLDLYGFCKLPKTEEGFTVLFTQRNGGMVNDTELLMLSPVFDQPRLTRLGRFLPELFGADRDLLECAEGETIFDTTQTFAPCHCAFNERLE